MSSRTGEIRPKSYTRAALIALALFLVLIVSITIGVSAGSAQISFSRVWAIVFDQLFPEMELFEESFPRNEISIVWMIRFPRVLLGAIVGAGLAIAGAVIQSLVRNSLADPYLLGISSGACSGAVFVILFAGRLLGVAAVGVFSVSFMAFVGATIAFAAVFLIAARGSGLSPVRMVLSGLAVSYIFTALTNFMVYMEQRNGAESAMFWMLGGLGGARWERLPIPLAIVVICLIAFTLYGRQLNALLLGDENAFALGVNVPRARTALFVATSILTGVIVAASGSIGFVGLIVPHAVRLVAGSDHRRVLPLSAGVGAIFLIWADLFARTALAPRELPLGIVTGFIGAPFFIFLLRRSAGGKQR